MTNDNKNNIYFYSLLEGRDTNNQQNPIGRNY